MGSVSRDKCGPISDKASIKPMTVNILTKPLLRDELTRSPQESPPVLKKKQKTFEELLAATQQHQPKLGDNILSNISNTMGQVTRAPTILKKKGRTLSRTLSVGQQKHVQFGANVTVHFMDDKGHICSECESLNTEAKSKHEFLVRNFNRAVLRQYQSCNGSAPLAQGEEADGDDSKRTEDQKESSGWDTLDRLHSYIKNSTTLPASEFCLEQENAQGKSELSKVMNISFCQDDTHGTKLKLVLHIGTEYDPENLVVKANLNGSKIRVMASKYLINPNGSRKVDHYNERFVLPMDVDPYQVEARLDTRGNLTVEAPLMTLTRRKAIAQGQFHISKAVTV